MRLRCSNSFWGYPLVLTIVTILGVLLAIHQEEQQLMDQHAADRICIGSHFQGARHTESGWACFVHSRLDGQWHVVAMEDAADYALEAANATNHSL